MHEVTTTKKIAIIAGALALAIIVIAFVAGRSGLPDGAVAEIDGGVEPYIWEQDVLAQMQEIANVDSTTGVPADTSGEQFADVELPAPGSDDYEALFDRAMSSLIHRAWVYSQARELGLEVSDDQVHEALVEEAADLGVRNPDGSRDRSIKAPSVNDLIQLRLAQGWNLEALRDAVRVQLLLEAIAEEQGLDEDRDVATKELRKTYKRNAAMFAKAPTFRARVAAFSREKDAIEFASAYVEDPEGVAWPSSEPGQLPIDPDPDGYIAVDAGESMPEMKPGEPAPADQDLLARQEGESEGAYDRRMLVMNISMAPLQKEPRVISRGEGGPYLVLAETSMREAAPLPLSRVKDVVVDLVLEQRLDSSIEKVQAQLYEQWSPKTQCAEEHAVADCANGELPTEDTPEVTKEIPPAPVVPPVDQPNPAAPNPADLPSGSPSGKPKATPEGPDAAAEQPETMTPPPADLESEPPDFLRKQDQPPAPLKP